MSLNRASSAEEETLRSTCRKVQSEWRLVRLDVLFIQQYCPNSMPIYRSLYSKLWCMAIDGADLKRNGFRSPKLTARWSMVMFVDRDFLTAKQIAYLGERSIGMFDSRHLDKAKIRH